MPDNATASQDMGHPQKGLEFQRHVFALPEILISGKKKHFVKYCLEVRMKSWYLMALICKAYKSSAQLENWKIS